MILEYIYPELEYILNYYILSSLKPHMIGVNRKVKGFFFHRQNIKTYFYIQYNLINGKGKLKGENRPNTYASCTPTCACADFSDLYFSVHACTKIGCSHRMGMNQVRILGGGPRGPGPPPRPPILRPKFLLLPQLRCAMSAKSRLGPPPLHKSWIRTCQCTHFSSTRTYTCIFTHAHISVNEAVDLWQKQGRNMVEQ